MVLDASSCVQLCAYVNQESSLLGPQVSGSAPGEPALHFSSHPLSPSLSHSDTQASTAAENLPLIPLFFSSFPSFPSANRARANTPPFTLCWLLSPKNYPGSHRWEGSWEIFLCFRQCSSVGQCALHLSPGMDVGL